MVAELIAGTKRQWRENWGAKLGGMCFSSWGEYGKGLCPFAHPPPQKICCEFYDGFRVIWCDITDLESTQPRADPRVMLYAIYSVHNEGVDHDNDTDNYHRHMSLISSWTVCTRELYAHALSIVSYLEWPWIDLQWPLCALLHYTMCSESTTKIWVKIDPHY